MHGLRVERAFCVLFRLLYDVKYTLDICFYYVSTVPNIYLISASTAIRKSSYTCYSG